MIGWILHACHRQPTVMNGAVMKNFVTPSAPFASALVGDPELFVSEVDESDGSIALYRPEDRGADQHQPRPQGDGRASRPVRRPSCCARARRSSTSTIPETRAIADVVPADKLHRLRLRQSRRRFHGQEPGAAPDGRAFALTSTASGHEVRLDVPGRHNASNALAAIAATRALGVPLEDAAARARTVRRAQAAPGNGRRRAAA